MQDHTVVLDRDDMRRTLVRIAHEIVEKNPPEPGGDRAWPIVGIHRRGAILAQRLHELTSELTRDGDPARHRRHQLLPRRPRSPQRSSTAAPVVHSTQLDFAVDGRTIVIVDDVLYTGRTARSAIDVLFDYGRPARVQLAVLVDRGHRELPIRPDYVGKNLPTAQDQRVNVHVEEIDGSDEVTIGPAAERQRSARMNRHLISIDDLDRAGIERILDRAHSFAEVSGREIKKVPALRGRTVVNLFYESSTRTSSSFELAAKRLSADVVSIRSAGSSVDKGESLRDTVQTLERLRPRRDRDPLAVRRRRRSRWRAGPTPPSSTPATASTSTRPRRCSTSSRSRPRSAASTASTSGSSATSCTRASRARTSSRSSGWAPGSRSPGRRRCSRETSRRSAARARRPSRTSDEADVVYVLRMQNERMHEAYVPSIREYAQRYQVNLARLRPGQLLMHPGPVNRGVELSRRRDRLRCRADRRPGQGRRRRADGGPLRAAGRRARAAGGGMMP